MFSSMITSFSLLELCRSTLFFFFNDTATTEIYTLSLHDALPILSVHDQAGALELAELLPGGPFRDQVRVRDQHPGRVGDRKSTRLNSSHSQISYAVFCLKKKNSSTSGSSKTETIPIV